MTRTGRSRFELKETGVAEEGTNRGERIVQTALDGAGPEAATQIGRYKKQKRLAAIHGIELEIADDALDSISEEAVTLDISPSRQIEGGLDLLSTHPTTDERIQRLEAKWKKMDRRSGFLEFQQRN